MFGWIGPVGWSPSFEPANMICGGALARLLSVDAARSAVATNAVRHLANYYCELAGSGS
jgi:hypothetical protein